MKRFFLRNSHHCENSINSFIAALDEIMKFSMERFCRENPQKMINADFGKNWSLSFLKPTSGKRQLFENEDVCSKRNVDILLELSSATLLFKPQSKKLWLLISFPYITKVLEDFLVIIKNFVYKFLRNDSGASCFFKQQDCPPGELQAISFVHAGDNRP